MLVIQLQQTTKTEEWNGTSWTEVNDLNTAINANAGADADNTSALSFGGISTGTTQITEEWSTGVPIGAWATALI